MKRIDIVKMGDSWIGESKGQVVSRGATKDDAIHNTARVAKADPEPVTVKIHKLDGKIQEERTYPRRADPSSSKG